MSAFKRRKTGLEEGDENADEGLEEEEDEQDDAEMDAEDEDDDSDDENPVVNVRIQNVCATLSTNIRLDLDLLQSSAKNAEYNPRRFAAVIMRIREPRTTALIFASGKIVVTGARSEDECKESAGKYVAIIKMCGHPQAGFWDYRVQNLTATMDTGFPVRLEALILAHQQHATYEPELFPGLIFKMDDPKVTCLIFVSGKVVMTGCKTQGSLEQAAAKMYPVLLDFRKKNITTTSSILRSSHISDANVVPMRPLNDIPSSSSSSSSTPFDSAAFSSSSLGYADDIMAD